MKKEKRIRYYSSFSEDFVKTRDQEFKLPPDYKWIRTSFFAKLLSVVTYGIAAVVGVIYCKLVLHMTFVNKKALRKYKNGCFIYCNHTQPFGDVVTPALACFPKRIYTVVSPSNLTIPIIGCALPYLGALPVPDTVSGLKSFSEAITARSQHGNNIVIYPEAHVWEYCTFIRPFNRGSFNYPVKLDKPVFCMTSVYKKRKWGKKPKTVVFIDGPFFPDGKILKLSERSENLRKQIYDTMTERSKENTSEYVKYIPL